MESVSNFFKWCFGCCLSEESAHPTLCQTIINFFKHLCCPKETPPLQGSRVTHIASLKAPLDAFLGAQGPHSDRALLTFYQEHAIILIQRGDDFLESAHNYIQWLFPLEKPSVYNPKAPLLTDAVISEFKQDLQLQERVLLAFKRMLKFYGLEMDEETGVIRKAPFFSGFWVKTHDHNHLRMTRMITSLRLLGLEKCAIAFHDAIQEIGNPVIPLATRTYWQKALTA